MLDTIFMILGVIFVMLIVFILAAVATGHLKFGKVDLVEDEHTDVDGTHG